MKLRYSNFKVTNNNGKGFWVSLRELNYMISEGVLVVDEEALDRYENTEIPWLSIRTMYDDYDMIDEMISSPTVEERSTLDLFRQAGEDVRCQIEADMESSWLK